MKIIGGIPTLLRVLFLPRPARHQRFQIFRKREAEFGRGGEA